MGLKKIAESFVRTNIELESELVHLNALHAFIDPFRSI